MKGSIKGIVPQLLVDDLTRAVACYRDRLGFDVDFIYEDFYAGVSRDGHSIHLKCAPEGAVEREHRRNDEHLDAYIDVAGINDLYEELKSLGANITRELEEQPWQCRDFYVEDMDGNVLCFSENLP